MFKLVVLLVLFSGALSANADDEFASAVEIAKYHLGYAEGLQKLLHYILFEDLITPCIFQGVQKRVNELTDAFIKEVNAEIGLINSDSAPYWQKHMNAEFLTEMSNSTLLKNFYKDNSLVNIILQVGPKCEHKH